MRTPRNVDSSREDGHSDGFLLRRDGNGNANGYGNGNGSTFLSQRVVCARCSAFGAGELQIVQSDCDYSTLGLVMANWQSTMAGCPDDSISTNQCVEPVRLDGVSGRFFCRSGNWK